MLKNPILKGLANELLNNKLDDKLWTAQLNSSDIVKELPQSYWRDVLLEWGRFTDLTPSNKPQVLNQQLWWNSKIRINNKLIHYKEWDKKGISHFEDILDSEGKPLTQEKLEEKLQIKIPFTKLAGLKKAIPREWWNLTKNQESKEVKDIFKELQKLDKITRIV